MEAVFTDIFNWIASLDPVWAYVIIGVIAYGENVIPPIPGDLVIVFGGYLASFTELNLLVVWGLATVGGALGFMSMYALGYAIGDAMYESTRFKWIPQRSMQRARDWILRWGYGVVLANRFLAGTRSVISLVVGIAQMHVGRTAAAASISACVWTGLISYAGYVLGENWEAVSGYLSLYGSIIISLVVAVGLFLLGRYWYRRRRQPGRQEGE